jgi:hypothetical protein
MRMCGHGATGTVRGMTDRAHPVLVGIDGTPSELEAPALASAFATLTGSRLRTALLASVSSALIERGSCPLIIVPRGTHPAPRSAASVAEVAHA